MKAVIKLLANNEWLIQIAETGEMFSYTEDDSAAGAVRYHWRVSFDGDLRSRTVFRKLSHNDLSEWMGTLSPILGKTSLGGEIPETLLQQLRSAAQFFDFLRKNFETSVEGSLQIFVPKGVMKLRRTVVAFLRKDGITYKDLREVFDI